MTRFVTVNMFLVQNSKQARATIQDVPGFLTWKVGYKVRGKNGGETWTIKDYEGAAQGDAISYHVNISLVNEDQTESKELRGSTLQSGYAFVSGTEEEILKATTKPLTFEVEALARFYARKNGQPGTRLMFKDRINYIVADDYEAVFAMVHGGSLPSGTTGLVGATGD